MNEPMQNELGDALRRLREYVAGQTAPDALEGQLLQAFRAHHAAPVRRRKGMWIPAAIAASLVVALAIRISEPVEVEAPIVPVVQSPVRKPAAVVENAPLEAVRKPKAPRKRRPRVNAPPVSVASSPRPAAQEQEFVRIPYAPPFTPYDEGHVVRVTMPGASARRMGVPVMMDRVQADLVVGHDGLPRAIRVVSPSGTQFR